MGSVTYTIKIGKYSCILREPTFDEYALATTAMITSTGQVNMAAAGKIIIQTCWIEGDEQIKKDDKLLFAASMKAASIINVQEAELKKN